MTVPARPSRPASVPVNSSAVKVRRFAVSMPTSWISARTPDMSGTRPRSTSLTHQRASGAVRRRSAASAICRPAPNTCPCTAATTGTGSRRQAQQASWNRLVPRGVGTNARATAAGLRAAAPRSRPAQNERPVPEMTTARRPGVRRSLRAVALSSPSMSSDSALSFSGRSRRTSAIPSERVQLMWLPAGTVDDMVLALMGRSLRRACRHEHGGAGGAGVSARPGSRCRLPGTAEPSPRGRRAFR